MKDSWRESKKKRKKLRGQDDQQSSCEPREKREYIAKMGGLYRRKEMLWAGKGRKGKRRKGKGMQSEAQGLERFGMGAGYAFEDDSETDTSE